MTAYNKEEIVASVVLVDREYTTYNHKEVV